MADRPRIAISDCAGCGGCDAAFLDLAGDTPGLAEAVEIVFWPSVLDAKRRDLEAVPDGSLAAAFVSGAVRMSDQEEMAVLLRRKSRTLVACGACASMGGVPGLANLMDRSDIMRAVYEGAPSVQNPDRVRPVTRSWEGSREAVLPAFRNRVRSLDQVVAVDCVLPGCPPAPALLKQAITAVTADTPPARGTVFAPDLALCTQCPRRESLPAGEDTPPFRRPHLAKADPGKCFLAQGLVCLGPATRAGCEAACPGGNMPCTGCFGPVSRVRDQGAKMLSALATGIRASEVDGIEEAVDGIVDPAGTLYRYGLARSLLRGRAGKREE